MSNNYKTSMNLPKTEYPMRASLAEREPQWQEKWERLEVHKKAVAARKDATPFILHDGPPYANGHIHMGTAYNKVLKDLIVKYKTMRGFYSPYVPGWDCHGQPIEHQVEKNLGPERMAEISKADLRTKCRHYALKFVDIQKQEFKRLGVLGDWDDPYLTLNHEYEAGNVEVFKKMFLDGSVYRGRKAIHWCMRCETALAEAEIEYGDDTSTSIYVGYELNGPTPWDAESQGLPVSVLIWTTTPWTLPANAFVVLNGEADYVGLRLADRVLVVAEALSASLIETLALENVEVLTTKVKGDALTTLTYKHPVHDDRTGTIITDAYVDLTTGTGAVHGAGGHGAEDNLLAVKHDLPIFMPVLDDGIFDAGGGPFEGNKVRRDDHLIVEWLKERGSLVAQAPLTHSYPHCWRCKEPVIFRATEQWFVSMEKTGLREEALAGFDTFNWIPAWSRNRMGAMIADRPDWCISRQRSWGVPIPVHRCAKCGEVVATEETFDATIALFKAEGADAWFIRKPKEYLPEGTSCAHCGCIDLEPESDIVDVWWESGVSHTAVLEARPELHRPAQLYLEGSDQHRGWFQSAYLTSMGAYGVTPFENLLTHGFIVDGNGRKMSKSLGNTMSPIDITKKLGADVIRLWVASTDYGQDINVSDEILTRTSEAYRRIRNTFRFLLSNLYDYDRSHAVAFDELREVDQAEMVRLADLLASITRYNDDWHFYLAQRELAEYITDLSATYLDILKDRLYAEAPTSPARRSAQTVLAAILDVLLRVMAPVLAFTTEEVWEFMPYATESAESVHLLDWPTIDLEDAKAEALRSDYALVRRVRDSVTKALEDARAEKLVGKSQEARVTVTVDAATAAVLNARPEGTLEELLIVADVVIVAADVEDVQVKVEVAGGDKCPRCWNYRTLGGNDAFPDVCKRCGDALVEIGFVAEAE